MASLGGTPESNEGVGGHQQQQLRGGGGAEQAGWDHMHLLLLHLLHLYHLQHVKVLENRTGFSEIQVAAGRRKNAIVITFAFN